MINTKLYEVVFLQFNYLVRTMELYAESLTEYKRLKTLEVKVGDLLIGNFNPIRIQTMTTTDTMDTMVPLSKVSAVSKQVQNWYELQRHQKKKQKIY